MKIGDNVKTCYGTGVIISREAETSRCFLVKLDNNLVGKELRELSEFQGGLLFTDYELEVIK